MVSDSVAANRRCGHFDPVGPSGPTDHACWAYASDDERATVASHWLAGGLAAGQRSFYVAEGTADELLAELAFLPDRDRHVESGSLVVVPTGDLYGPGAIDPEPQLAVYSAAVRQAVEAGYRGLRVAADITSLVSDIEHRSAHLRWEQYADRYISTHPLTPVCMYDVRRISGILPIVCAHPLRGPAGTPFALFATGPTAAALVGEVDAVLDGVFSDVLAGLPPGCEVLDLSGLSYIHPRCAGRLNAELATRRASGENLTLSSAEPLVRRIWEGCGFDPGLLGG